MSTKHKHDTNFHGLIADTMEMPAVTSDQANAPERVERKKSRRKVGKQSSSLLIAVLAIVGSFTLGLLIRMAVGNPQLLDNIAPVVPGIKRMASPEPLEPGVDITAELGHKVEVPMVVQQVLPFQVQNGSKVLGGYLLTGDGNADKKRPVMAVFANRDLDQEVSPDDLVIVGGYVVMTNGTQQEAASVLQPEQERDLTYIVQRVNFWDRVTIMGTHTRPYELP